MNTNPSELQKELDALYEALEGMSPRSGVRGALAGWHKRLVQAARTDARLQESPVAPRSAQPPSPNPRSGVFDVGRTQERQYWSNGRCYMTHTRAQVEKFSAVPWGHYPDLEP